MTFHGVAGRPTLAEDLRLYNDGRATLSFSAAIEGESGAPPAFMIEGMHYGIVQADRTTAMPGTIRVRYAPTTAGHHTAKLVVRHDLGETKVDLRGTAMDLGEAARTEASSGLPEPIHDLGDTTAHTKADRRSDLLRAADTVSSLARTYSTTVLPADATVTDFSESIHRGGAQLNGRILDWLNQEGVDETARLNDGGKETGIGELVKFLTIKGLEHAAEALAESGGNVLAAAAVVAVDLGWDAVNLVRANQELDHRTAEYEERIAPIARLAREAVEASTRALARRCEGLMIDYASSCALLHRIGGNEAGQVLASLQHSLARLEVQPAEDVNETYARAQELVADYTREQDVWARAYAQIAKAAVSADAVANAGFAKLIEQYVAFRASGEGKKPGAEHEVTITGTLDVSPPVNVQLISFQFGEFSGMSRTVTEVMGSKTLADLAKDKASVTIRLKGIYEGMLELKQDGAERSHHVDAQLGDAVTSIGIDTIWKMLDESTIHAGMIRGAR